MSSFGDIRAFFASPPPEDDLWSELIPLLEAFSPREQLVELVLPYCRDHLEQLCILERPLGDAQLRRLLGGFEVPIAALVTTLSLKRERLFALQLGELRPEELARMLQGHPWASLRAVELSGQRNPLGLLEVLLEHPIAGQLERIVLERCPLGDQGLEVLARNTSLTRLKHLELRQAQLAERGVACLFGAAWFPSLEVLGLGGNPSAERVLMELGLEGDALALRRLDLGGIHSSARVFTAILNSARLRGLTELDFSYNPFEADMLGDFRDSGMRLERLNLASCRVDEGDLLALALAEQARGITALDLSWNEVERYELLLADEAVFPRLGRLWLSPSKENSAQREELACALRKRGVDVRWRR